MPSRATIPPYHRQHSLPRVHLLFATNSLPCLTLCTLTGFPFSPSLSVSRITTDRQLGPPILTWFLFISYIPWILNLRHSPSFCLSSPNLLSPSLIFLLPCALAAGELQNWGTRKWDFLRFVDTATIIYYGTVSSPAS